jgi:hypothetical protein
LIVGRSRVGSWWSSPNRAMRLDAFVTVLLMLSLYKMAEAVGFEPTNGCPLPVFKTGVIDLSTTLPIP